MSEENNENGNGGGADVSIDLNNPAIKAQIDKLFEDERKKLTAKNDELLREKKAVTEKLKAFGDADPDEVRALREAREKAELDEAKNQGNWQKVLEDRDKKAAEKLAAIESALKSKVDRAEAYARNLLKDREVTDALVKAKVAPEMMRAAKLLIGEMVDISEDEETGWRAIGKYNGDDMSVLDMVTLWAESEEGRYFVQAPLNNGGGSGPKSGGGKGRANPWKQDTWNVTEQGRIYKEDARLAEQMKREAGAR